jgi:hypothetical protein
MVPVRSSYDKAKDQMPELHWTLGYELPSTILFSEVRMIPNPALILCSSDPQVRSLHSARALDERR